MQEVAFVSPDDLKSEFQAAGRQWRHLFASEITRMLCTSIYLCIRLLGYNFSFEPNVFKLGLVTIKIILIVNFSKIND